MTRRQRGTKRLIPSTHLLMAFANKGLPAADAISELIDNALGKAGATRFEFQFAPDRVIAIDNGCGVSDIDSLFGLGYSESRHISTDIGEFGIGSKDAQMHFGNRCRVQSVHQRRYYDHSIDWAKVRTSRFWPKAFNGESQPASKAPKEIRKSGTLITITHLADRPRINIDLTVKKLAHRYRPALLKGKEITITDGRRGTPTTYELAPSLAALGVQSRGTTVEGEVEGRKFWLMYTALKQYDAMLSGVHFGFENRFIEHSRELAGTGMPSMLYAEVMLSPDWKGFFSPNKTKIIRFKEQLQTAVLALLTDWIKKLAAQSEQLKIEHVNLALKTDFNNVIVLDRKRTGDSVRAGDTKTSGGRGGGGGSGGGLKQDEELAKAGTPGRATKEKRNRPCGVAFRRADDLGDYIASSHELTSDNSLVISLNGTIPVIAVAYEPPYKPIALWPIIAREFGKFCQQNVARLDALVPGFLDALNAMGYEVSAEYPDELADKVFAYVMKQVPLSARERAILNHVHAIEDAA